MKSWQLRPFLPRMNKATRMVSLLVLFLVTVEGKTGCLEWDLHTNIDTRSNVIYQTLLNDTTTDNNQEEFNAVEIMTRMLEKLKELLKNGDTQHDTPSIDPQEFSIARTVEDDNLKMTMSFDGRITNTSNIFWNSVYTCPLTMQTQMEIIVKDVFINGTYNLTGMAYDAFPIFGDGDFQMNIDEINLMVIAEVSPKKGDYPLEMDKLYIHFIDLQGMKANFENLMGDDDVALLVSHLAADISEKIAYNVVSSMEEDPNAVLYSIVADRISKTTLLDIVSFINNM